MTRRVLFVGFPGVQTVDLVGPFEVFAVATRALAAHGNDGYAPELVSLDGEAVSSEAGLSVAAAPPPDQYRKAFA